MAIGVGGFSRSKEIWDRRTENQKSASCWIKSSIGINNLFLISAGQDIQAHNDSSRKVIMHVRNWLRNASRRETIPGGSVSFGDVTESLEGICLKQFESVS